MPNNFNGEMPERSRTWVRSLGQIVAVDEAAALKQKVDADRRALRLSAKAERAAAAGPSTVNHVTNITNNNVAINCAAASTSDAEHVTKRLRGDIRGFFGA